MKSHITLEDIEKALKLIGELPEEILYEDNNVIISGRGKIPGTITLKKQAAKKMKKFIKEYHKKVRKDQKIGKITTFCGVPIFVTDEKK